MRRRAGLLGVLLSLFGCGDAPVPPDRAGVEPSARAPSQPASARLATFEADGYELDDGERMHAAAPETFPIPDAERRRSLRPGAVVKLVFRMQQSGTGTLSVERMWVRVTEARDGRYVGVLDNDPVGRVRVKCGDGVTFEARHVIDVSEE